MLKFKEKMGSVYLMDEKDEAIYEVTEPAVLFDKVTFTVHKVGNKDVVQKYFDECIEKCKRAGSDLYESWLLMDLPKDAEIMDKLLNNSGYMERFLKQNGIELLEV